MMTSPKGLSVAELMRSTGASRKALHVYEGRGLIKKPLRNRHGWREYSPKVIEEVRFIREALAAGLRLQDVKPSLDV